MSIQEDLSNSLVNTTILREEIVHGFVSSAQFRGTLDILWSCILTIVACVYTAIHLHIPVKGTSIWKRLGQKLRWAAVAILAPELVLQAAFRQWREARSLVNKLNEAHFEEPGVDKDDDPQDPSKKDEESKQPMKPSKKFKTGYGFFVVMGGIKVSTTALHDKISTVTLTRQGVALLAAHGHFIEIPDDEIADRSKANPLAKALVCIQVLWFFLQCIVRTSRGYPLALIEVHTMVHVVCAVLIYMLWWKKPLDIELPIEIDASRFQDILALLLMSNGAFNPRDTAISELSEIQSWPTPEQASTVRPESESSGQVSTTLETETLGEGTANNTSLTLEAGKYLPCGFGLPPDHLGAITLSEKDQLRWSLCAKATSTIPEVDYGPDTIRLFDETSPKVKEKLLEFYPKVDRGVAINGVIDTISGGSEHYFHQLTQKVNDWNQFAHSVQATALLLLPIIYGGVHLAAREFAFPSQIEKTLWEISCIATMVMLPAGELLLVIFGAILIVGIAVVELLVCSSRKTFSEDRFAKGFVIVNVGLLGFYVACRAYIVVEVFISLRSTPLGVYTTTPWLQSIPHV